MGRAVSDQDKLILNHKLSTSIIIYLLILKVDLRFLSNKISLEQRLAHPASLAAWAKCSFCHASAPITPSHTEGVVLFGGLRMKRLAWLCWLLHCSNSSLQRSLDLEGTSGNIGNPSRSFEKRAMVRGSNVHLVGSIATRLQQAKGSLWQREPLVMKCHRDE